MTGRSICQDFLGLGGEQGLVLKRLEIQSGSGAPKRAQLCLLWTRVPAAQ